MSDTVYLARSENGNITQVRNLSSLEVEKYNSIFSVVSEFNRHYKLLEYVFDNFNEFRLFLENVLKNRANSEISVDGFDYSNFVRKLNGTILNLMMSVRTFLDHMQTHISRVNGEDSKEFMLFKSLTANEFDNEFSYAFIAKLRNFVQHCGMPPIKFLVRQNYESSPQFIDIVLKFEKAVLLKEFKKWGPVKQRLLNQAEEFDVIPIIEGLMSSLLRIYVKFTTETSYNQVVEAKSKMLAFIDKPESYRINNYCIVENMELNGNDVNLQLRWIPVSLLDRITDFEKLKKKI